MDKQDSQSAGGYVAPPPVFSLEALRTDFLSSFVVFLVALPLCMGIAIASGAPVAAGLITGIVGGLIVGFLSGQPMQVSGPAAGLTVVMYGIIQEHGLATMGAAVLVGGALQLLAGVSGLAQWFRAVSPAVIRGMLTGIGVLIAASQIHVMVDQAPKDSGPQNIMAIPAALADGLELPTWQSGEARDFRATKLEALHALYAEQKQVYDQLGRVLPERAMADDVIPERILRETRESQASVTQGLGQFRANLGNVEARLGDPQEAARLRASTEQAWQASRLALAALNEGRVEDIRPTQQATVAALQAPLGQLKSHAWAGKLGVLTILIIVFWQVLTPKKMRLIPGPLVATVGVSAIAVLFTLPVLHVDVPDSLVEGVNLLMPAELMKEHISFSLLVKSGIIVALIASAETLLCATAVDLLHRGPRTNYGKELRSQGVGNMICGVLGGLPMTGVIVRSSVNVAAGARTRLSAILHGVWLLVFVAALAFVLRMIPTAVLAGILVHTGWKLMNLRKNFIELRRYGKSEVAIWVATLSVIVLEDLLTGVLFGVFLAGIKLLYRFSHLETDLEVNREQSKASLVLAGTATFPRLPKLAAELEKVPDNAELHVDLHDLRYIDHACLELFMTWAKQHESLGGRLVLDWEYLHARFDKERAFDVRKGLERASGASDSRVA